MKILILGHNGLLGNMVLKYFKSKNYNIITTNLRWNNDNFKEFVKSQKVDYIINCIGLIPQKNNDKKDYMEVNYNLPMWLDSLGVKILQSDTDEDNSSPYGFSKRKAREDVIKNTKMIKTSIIGFEKKDKCSFLEWFLNSEDEISGFTNQYWNGNTTLEWSKWAEKIIKKWDKFSNVITIENPNCYSKYEILNILKRLFNKNIKISPIEIKNGKNNCLKGDFVTNNLINQLIEMKYFYNKN